MNSHLLESTQTKPPEGNVLPLCPGREGKSEPRARGSGLFEKSEMQIFFNQTTNNKHLNFYKPLIFKIMKKQFLFLAFFVLASIAGITTALGQVTCPTPRPIDATCLPNDAIHPLPGVPYDYIVDVPTPTGTKEYLWFVTQDPNFITTTAGVTSLTTNRETTSGDYLVATGTGYNDPANGSSTLSLTWKSFAYDPSNPVFVVIQVKSTEAGECDPNNLKVYRIEPVFAFTLDIANIGADKTTVSPYETSIDRCISPILSAVYDPADGQVRYDFGADTLYFVVTAANFTTSWLPSIQISGLDANETVTSVDWFRPTDNLKTATPNTMTLNAGVYTADDPVLALDASGTVSTAGECIVVRVAIDHTTATAQYEGIIDQTIAVAVDGKTELASATPKGDLHFSSTVGVAADCGKEDDFRNDIATQVLKARPDVQTATPLNPGPGDAPFLNVK